MKQVTIGKHSLLVYDSIEDLPITRFHKFNKLMLVEAGVGSSVSDLDEHLARVSKYVLANELEKADKELQNLRQCLYLIQSEITPENMAYAALVYSIDGKVYSEPTDDAIAEITAKLSDISKSQLSGKFAEVKKKLDSELEAYFPSLSDSSKTKEYYAKLKRRTLLILSGIGSDEKETDKVEELSDELLLHLDPMCFTGPESLEIQQDKQFEDACLAISRVYNKDAKRLTVLEYYNAIFSLKRESEEASKKKKRK